MATAGTATYNTTGLLVYDDTDGCTSFMVHVVSSSSNPALISVGGLHPAADFLTLRPGATQVFRVAHRGVKTVFIKGSGGDAVVDWGVVAKT